MATSNYPQLYAERVAALETVFGQTIENQKPIFEQIFKVEPWPGKGVFHWKNSLSGLRDPVITTDGTAMASDRIYVGFPKKFTLVKPSLKVLYTEDDVNHDQDGIMAAIPKALGEIYPDYNDTIMINLLQNGFTSTTTPDAAYLFSLSHVNHRGQTYANMPTTAIGASYSNFFVMYNLIVRTQDQSGFRYNKPPQDFQVISGPENLRVWKEIFPGSGSNVSVYDPSSEANNRATNVANKEFSGNIIIHPKILSQTAWFVSAGKEYLRCPFYFFQKPTVTTEDIDKDTKVGKVLSSEEVGYGFWGTDGIWASAGA